MPIAAVRTIATGRRLGGVRALMTGVLVVASVTFARAQAPFDNLHYFDDQDPSATSIVQASDGDFYITAARGGAEGLGVIFRMTAAGVQTPLHAFDGSPSDGANPNGPLLQASDGNFYGTTARGGSSNLGTVFRMTADGSITVLHSFVGGAADGADPKAGLIQATDGKVYGTTSGGGPVDCGTVFSMTVSGAMALVHVFAVNELGHPHTALFQAADGRFYGATPISLFRVTGSGVFTELFSPGALGFFQPSGPLLQTADGVLYARGMEGIPGNPPGRRAMVVQLSPNNSAVGLNHQDWRIGQPGVTTALFSAADGAFYGLAASVDPSSQSGLFRIPGFPATAPTIPAALTSSTLHGFDAGLPDALIQASDGNFYGTIVSSDAVTVFRATADGVVDPLSAFTVAPRGGVAPTTLVQAADEDLYGTTEAGGGSGDGTLFRMTRAGVTTVLHAFQASADGAAPNTLLQAVGGLFYGTTTSGGANGKGTVFAANAAGAVTLLHSFDSAATGAAPSALIQGADGQFYGTTATGGVGGGGTVFRMTSAGVVTVLHAFTGGADGAGPGSLVQGPDGNFYGTNASACTGRVFRMTPDGAVTVLWSVSLTGGANPCNRFPGIILGRDGNLYGTTVGNISGYSAKFYKVTMSGTVAIIRELAGSPGPTDLLVQFSDGSFYGPSTLQAVTGRSDGIASITLAGTVTFLRTFDSRFSTSSAKPRLRSLVQGSDGSLYGTSGPLPDAFSRDSIYSSAVAFRLFPPSPPQGLTVGPTGTGQVRLTWAPAGGAIRYRITRRNSSGVETVLDEVTATSFVDATAVRGQRYFYTVTTITGYGDSGRSYLVAITAGRAMAGDFDGDGMADIGVFRPSTGTWYLTRSNAGTPGGFRWGNAADTAVPADYDGDGKIDIAVFRRSTGEWFVVPSGTGVPFGLAWGNGADTPVAADYDGDGKADIAVFRPSNATWFIVPSTTAIPVGLAWGHVGDTPVPGDYDGDGKTDLAVFQPSTGVWSVLNSSTGASTDFAWGNWADHPVAADYDGDGRTDIAVFRPSDGVWYVMNSATGTPSGTAWGNALDLPVPGDYDGDGRTDIAVFRPSDGAWYVRNSRTGTPTGFMWGNGADVPILKR